MTKSLIKITPYTQRHTVLITLSLNNSESDYQEMLLLTGQIITNPSLIFPLSENTNITLILAKYVTWVTDQSK